MMRWNALVSCLFLFAPRLAAQELTVEIGGFEKPEVIQVMVQPEGRGGWTEELQSNLIRSRRGTIKSYDLYYDYEQSFLIPRSEEPCYLHLFIVDPRHDPASDVRRVWHQKYLMTVRGNFIDQAVSLPVTVAHVSDERSARTGTIEVIAHNPYPVGVLLPQHPDPEGLEIEVPTNSASEHDIFFANRSGCCEIQLSRAEVRNPDEDLWSKLEIRENDKMLQPDEAKSFQPWLSLALRPRASQAFWSSFSPYDVKKPHADLKLNIFFKVKNGREARLQQVVRVRFAPPFSMVLVSVVLGALLATVLSLFVVGLGSKQGTKLVFGDAATRGAKAAEVTKRILLSVFVSLTVFFLYMAVKGEKRVILFEFPLDPTQCTPAFLIGLLVGSRPTFYYKKLTEWSGRSGRRAGAWALFTAALILGNGNLAAQERTDFRPVSLDYDSESDTLYVLSSPSNRIYRLDPLAGRIKEIGKLELLGLASDACLVKWRGAAWIASVTSRRIGFGDTWQVSLTLTPTQGGPTGPARKIVGFGQFFGIAFDERNARILLTDRFRDGIYSAPLTAQGIGEPKQLFRHRLLNDPISIAVRPVGLFVTSRERRTVFRVDLGKGEMAPLVRDVADPAGLAVSPDGKRLLMVDAAQAEVHEYILPDGGTKVLLDNALLREPRAVQVDRRDHIWVADSWSRAILEFSPNGQLLRRHTPSR